MQMSEGEDPPSPEALRRAGEDDGGVGCYRHRDIRQSRGAGSHECRATNLAGSALGVAGVAGAVSGGGDEKVSGEFGGE